MTPSLRRFEITTDPDDEALTASQEMPFELHIVFGEKLKSGKERGLPMVGCRLFDGELGIVAESLNPWSLSKNRDLASRRLDLARANIGRRPPIPGVKYIDRELHENIDRMHLAKFVMEHRGIEMPEEFAELFESDEDREEEIEDGGKKRKNRWVSISAFLRTKADKRRKERWKRENPKHKGRYQGGL